MRTAFAVSALIVSVSSPVSATMQLSAPTFREATSSGPVADSLAESRRLFDVARRAFDARLFEMAADTLSRAAQLNHGDSRIHLWLGNALAQQAMRANLARKLFLSSRIRDAWRRAIAIDPRNVEARENLIAFYESVPAIAGGGREKAIAEAKEAQSVMTYLGTVWLARVLENGNDSTGALAAYASAKRLPDDSTGRAFEGWLYTMSQFSRYTEVFAAVDARLQQSPNDGIALAYLARTAARSAMRCDDGLRALARAERLQLPSFMHFDTEFGFSWYRGKLLEEKRDFAGAAVAYRAALAKSPNDASVARDLARVSRP